MAEQPKFLDYEETSRVVPAEFQGGDVIDLHARSEHVAPYDSEEAARRRQLAREALDRNTPPKVERSPESERLGQIGLTLVRLRQAATREDFELAA